MLPQGDTADMPGLIRTGEDPYYTQRTKLDGRTYRLDFSYNEREQRWYLSIYDDDENPLILGLKLIANLSLLYRHRADPRIPAGELTVTDLTGDGTPPTLKELGEGKRCQLLYWTQAELAEIGNG